jgi:hypothetical protein
MRILIFITDIVSGKLGGALRFKKDPSDISEHAAERTVEGLWSAIGKFLDCYRPDECIKYLRHCGYNATITRSQL